MRIIADLHIHSRFSRATSKALDISHLEKYARIKGVDILGTGDFTHPKWQEELKRNLDEGGEGIYTTATGFKFLLQTELSFVYTQGRRGRRIHLVVLAPDMGSVEQLSEFLATKGRLDYDGRPIFNMSIADFTYEALKINPLFEIIPAHAWTPWFGVFGSKSGFDSLEEAFLDQRKNIHAIETGLSSDPPMNWRLSSLDKVNLVSNSDSHSFWPWRIGREATIFDLKNATYRDIVKAIRTGEGLKGTVEVDPAYGKYHYDGHRACNVSMKPSEAMKNNNICPVCKRELTIGVLHRVEELADRPEGYTPEGRPGFYSLIPLSEIIAHVINRGLATKDVWKTYYALVKPPESSEFDVLLNTPYETLEKAVGEELASAVISVREGRLKIKPGYDGEYGVPLFKGSLSEKEKKIESNREGTYNNQRKRMQTSLLDFNKKG